MKRAQLLLPVILITIVAIAIACSKSNNGAKPKISIKSCPTDIPVNGDLNMEFNVIKGAANVSGGAFWAIRLRQNEKPLQPGTIAVDTIDGPVPAYPEESKPVFQYLLPYSFLHQSDEENDTVIFKIFVIDVAGKSSDTIMTPKIVIHTP